MFRKYEVASWYGISVPTLNKWLVSAGIIKEKEDTPLSKRMITPLQIRMIFKEFGIPPKGIPKGFQYEIND